MRVAISAENNHGLESIVSHHFGRCPFFVIVDLNEGEIKSVDMIANPYFAQHQPGMVPGFIHDRGADVMISGGMGRRAITFFKEYDIGAATGASGTVGDALNDFINGKLNEATPCRESVQHSHGRHHHHDHH